MMITPEIAFAIFLVVGLTWTIIWAFVLKSTTPKTSYSQLLPGVAKLRKRLFYLTLSVLTVVFLVSMLWLPYPYIRAIVMGEPQITVDVIGTQYEWKISQRELPVGVPIEFRVTATDVNHGFGIYSPDGKLVAQVQAMPGYVNRLIYVFTEPGEYKVLCIEYCGLGHPYMIDKLTVK